MKERPILFSGEMVRAILEGRKTMTRRVVNGMPESMFIDWVDCAYIQCTDGGDQYKRIVCPHGIPGDRLWVKETWYDNLGVVRTSADGRDEVYYRADGLPDMEGEEHDLKWRPSIHMPRWASRLTLEIVSVKVERLRGISEKDCFAEGAPPIPIGGWPDGTVYPRPWFQQIWDSTDGKKPGCSWQENPWVWAIEFKVVEADS